MEPGRQVLQGTSHPNRNEEAETVITLGRRVYRCCKQSPELLVFDPATLWRMIFDAAADDEDAKQMLVSFRDTSTWTMAVLTAKLMHEVYAAGGLDEEPA
jgi:hypothetical protein